jgi:hypothetical protein
MSRAGVDMAAEPRTAGRAERRESSLAYFAHAKEASTYWGALVLVTSDGDPTDFIYTEPVTLNAFMKRLLGPRADAYVVGRVLLQPLLAHLAEAPALLCFDDPIVLQRRLDTKIPVAVLASPDAPHRAGAWAPVRLDGEEGVTCWLVPDSREEVLEVLRETVTAMAPFGLLEPFRQLRDAMDEMKREREKG